MDDEHSPSIHHPDIAMRSKFRSFRLKDRNRKKSTLFTEHEAQPNRQQDSQQSQSHQIAHKSSSLSSGNDNGQQLTVLNGSYSLSLEEDLGRVRRLYHEEAVRANLLNNERELLESSLLSKEKVILSQSRQINSLHNLLANYKKNINDELTYFENDYNIWLEEKHNYETRIKALQKVLQKNNIVISGRPESLCSIASNSSSLSNFAARTSDSSAEVDASAILEENNNLRVRIQSLKTELASITNKCAVELQFKDNLLEELGKWNEEKKQYLDQIRDLKSELDDATKQFGELNENISFHHDNSHVSLQVDTDDEDQVEDTDHHQHDVLPETQSDGDRSSEIKYTSFTSTDHSKNNKNLVLNTLDKELRTTTTSMSSDNYTALSLEFKNLEQQYKYQSNILINLRFELNSANQENQQLFFFINQLLKDNDYLQKKMEDMKRLSSNDKKTEVSMGSLEKQGINHELNEHVQKVREFLDGSKVSKNSLVPAEDVTSARLLDDTNANKENHASTETPQTPVASEPVSNSHNLMKFFTKKALIKKNVLRSSSLSTNSSTHSHENNVRYKVLAAGNRISRIISNNVDSNYSLNEDIKKQGKKKRNTIIGVVNPNQQKPQPFSNKENEEDADESLMVNLKPLKIQKHSRTNSSVSLHSNSDSKVTDHIAGSDDYDNDAGNVSLNASISLKGLQKTKFMRQKFLLDTLDKQGALKEEKGELGVGNKGFNDAESVKSEISLIVENNDNNASIVYHHVGKTDDHGAVIGEGGTTDKLISDTILEESSYIETADEKQGHIASFSDFVDSSGIENVHQSSDREENNIFDETDSEGAEEGEEGEEEEEEEEENDDDDDDDDDYETQKAYLATIAANYFKNLKQQSFSTVPSDSELLTDYTSLRTFMQMNYNKHLSLLGEKNLNDNPIMKLLLFHQHTSNGQKLLTNVIDPDVD